MAKRSRRARKEATTKAQQNQNRPIATVENLAEVPVISAPANPIETPKPSMPGKAIDFGTEYYYVYTELRNIALVAAVMFALMVGLGFFI